MADGDKNGDPVDLAEIRKRINEVDVQIQDLINERARFAQQVGVAKGKLASAVDYYRPEREAEILRNVMDRNQGPLRNEEMLRLFREINARGTTIVVATHDRDLIKRMQRRTIVLKRGRVVDVGNGS